MFNVVGRMVNPPKHNYKVFGERAGEDMDLDPAQVNR